LLNIRALIPTIALAALLAVSSAGCVAKPAGTQASGGKAGTAMSASSSAQHSAAEKPTTSPTALPTPSPTPTEPPVGTILDGWVVGIPDYVPRFAFGTIDRSQSKIVEGSVGSLFTLCFNGVTKTNLDGYATALKSAGFVVATGEINMTYTLTASLGGEWINATLVLTLNEGTGAAVYSLEVPV
jgi:hypothetical protein